MMDEIQKLINDHPALMLYFSHDDCNVCKVLKLKIMELLKNTFPWFHFLEVDTIKSPDIAAQFSIFSVPTLLVYFDKSEFFRFSRYINLNELTDLLTRPYALVFK